MIKRLFPILAVLLAALIFACPAMAEENVLRLPAGTKEIKAEAFAGSAAEYVIVPEGAYAIESGAFAGSNLKQIQLPVSMSGIADDAFGEAAPLIVCVQNSYPYGWANGLGLPVLACTVNAEENRATIVSYNGNLSTLRLPDEVMGYPVTAINGSVFSGNRALEKVILPENLRSIGANAFYGCENLSDVVFNDGLTTIEGRAFQNCKALVEANLPDSVTAIRYEAFLNCTSLNSFDYPTGWVNTNTNNDDIFKGCTSLKSITVPEGVTTLPIAAFHGANKLEEVILPESLTSISNYAFSYTSALKSIELPASVETIGEFAFSGSGLETVTLPESLTTIKRAGFSECKSLTDVAFNDGLTTIGSEAFENSSALVEADLPDSVTTILYDAFRNCSALASFHYPTGWTSTDSGYNAQGYIFAGCKSFTSVVVPEGVTAIPAYAFDHASYLTSVSLPSTLTSISDYTFQGCTALNAIEIPDSVAAIGEFAFSGTSLVTVTLPESLTTIEREGFSECKSLTDVAFNNGLTTLCDGAFMNCTALVEADLPDSVQVIEHDVFRNCSSLESFDYPMNWNSTNPGYNAWGNIFYGCEKFTSVTVPEGVTALPSYAFDGANYLTDVSLPESLTSISDNAFQGCSALKAIEIPASVETIGEYAFSGSGLETVALPKKLSSIKRECFSECKSLTDVEFNDSLTTLCDGAFMNCTALLEADLPDSVHTMEYDVFNGCTSLKFFDYPASLEYVNCWGSSADNFKGCSALESITVPAGVTSIPESLFSGSNYLETVYLPSTLTTIGSYAFENCSALKDIYIPVSVVNFGNDCFAGCPNLCIESEYGAVPITYAINNSHKYYYLSLTGRQIPSGNVYIGDGFTLLGYVRSTQDVTNVTATVYSADGSTVLQQSIAIPAVHNYNLQRAVSSEIDFAALELGSYRFTLTASTDKSSETLANTSFNIVPQPLRAYSEDYLPFDGYNEAGTEQLLRGVITANYPITRLEVRFFLDDQADGSAADKVFVLHPNTESYDLADAQINLCDLTPGCYTMEIYVEGNGESKILGRNSFIHSGNALPDGISVDYEKLLSFLENDGNARMFNGIQADYTYTIEQNMSTKDVIALALATYKDFTIDTIYNAGLEFADLEMHVTHEYYVDLYKKDICLLIADMENLDTYEHNEDLVLAVSKLWSEYGTVSLELVQALGIPMSEFDELFIETLGKSFEKLGKAVDLAKLGVEFGDVLQNLTVDYSRGMYVLDSLTDDPRYGNQNYQEAVNVLKARFSSKSRRAVEEIFEFAAKKAIELGGDAVIEAFLTATTGPLYKGIKIINLSNDVLKELLDLYGDSEDYWSYKAMCETFSNARSVFSSRFEELQDNPENAQLIAALVNDFNVTKRAAERALTALTEMKEYKGVNYDYVSENLDELENMSLPFLNKTVLV